MPPTLPFRCSRAYRTTARPECRLKALPVARKNGHFFFYLSCVHVFFQCKKMRNGMTAMRLFADGCLFEDPGAFVRRLDPKDPGADRGRAVSPRSRAIVVTFDVATCAAFLPVSVSRPSVATSSARDELSDLAQGSSEGRNRAYGTRSAARACRSGRSTTTRPSATFAKPRSSTGASRWPRSSATACSALTSPRASPRSSRTAATSRMCRRRSSGTTSQQAADPHLRRHARVVRRDPGRRAALRGAGRPRGLLPPVKGNRQGVLFDLYKPFDNTTTSRRHNQLGRHRVPPSYEV